jgi:hypothetical protein
VLLAIVLAVVLLPPLAELTVYICQQFPNVQTLLREGNPLTRELEALGEQSDVFFAWLQYFLVLGVLAPVCEELAFRGFILAGLRRYFRTWTAILFSSFLFALYHANVFQFVPAFLLGVVLALFAVRTGSIVPGVVFHMIHNCLLLLVYLLERGGFGGEEMPAARTIRLIVVSLCTLLACVFLWRLWLQSSAPLVPSEPPEPTPQPLPNGEPGATIKATPDADELVP